MFGQYAGACSWPWLDTLCLRRYVEDSDINIKNRQAKHIILSRAESRRSFAPILPFPEHADVYATLANMSNTAEYTTNSTPPPGPNLKIFAT